MKTQLILPTLIISLFSFNTYSQQLNLGLKVDVIKFVRIEPVRPDENVRSLTPLPAFFLKFGVLFFDKFELELDGGYQLGDRFNGVETAVLAKYRLWDNISPFITYFNHQNDGHEGAGTGISSYTYNFLGAGAELKLSEIFSVDMGYYLPIGESGYDYEYASTGTGDFKRVNTSQIGSLFRVGIIFSFNQ